MGKLGVVSFAVVAALAALLPAREAAAQDFGQSWVDRITHEQEQDRGPLNPKAFNWTGDVGLQYAFDNNIFLTHDNKKSDSIVIPFVQAGMSYTEPRFDVEASLLANYKYYTKEDADDDEERVYVRARQTSARWNFEVSELFQNVSDPSGVVFLNRVSRMVSTTTPKMAIDLGRSWSLELGGNLQFVRFQDQPYSSGQENFNFDVAGAVVYRTPWAFDLVAQFGYYNINYETDQGVLNGTPDLHGYKYRVGFRGNLSERLSLEMLVGYSSVETDFFIATNNDISEGTMVIDGHLRYEASETVNFYFDFSRFYAFEGFGDPFQLVNTGAFILQMEVSEGFKLRGRLQVDYSETALNVKRTYYAATFGATYKFSSHWLVDGSLMYRGGKTENVGEVKFNDLIFALGAAFTW
jgi:hypothetical protein